MKSGKSVKIVLFSEHRNKFKHLYEGATQVRLSRGTLHSVTERHDIPNFDKGLSSQIWDRPAHPGLNGVVQKLIRQVSLLPVTPNEGRLP